MALPRNAGAAKAFQLVSVVVWLVVGWPSFFCSFFFFFLRQGLTMLISNS
jgi:hypothetical protein